MINLRFSLLFHWKVLYFCTELMHGSHLLVLVSGQATLQATLRSEKLVLQKLCNKSRKLSHSRGVGCTIFSVAVVGLVT